MPKCLPLLALALAVALPAARADVPAVPAEVVTNGRLLDGNDRPVSGMQTLTFGLFVSSVRPQTPDQPVWTETYQVDCDSNGLYQVALGGASDDSGASGKKPLDAEVFRENPQLFLEVKVAQTTLAPRLPVGATPFALFAAAAADADALGGHAPDYYATAASDAAKVAGVGAAPPLAVDATDPTHPSVGLARASGSADGYLAHDDFAAFSAFAAKVDAVTADAPLAVGGDAQHPSVSLAAASATADGYLAKADFQTFAAKQDALTASAPVVLDASGHIGVATDDTLQVDGASRLGVKSAKFIQNGTSTQPASLAIDGSAAVGSLASAGAVRASGLTVTSPSPTNATATFRGATDDGSAPTVAVDYGAGPNKGDGIDIAASNTGDAISLKGSSGNGFFKVTSAYGANPNVVTSGKVVAGGDVTSFGYSLTTVQNVRAFFPKASADSFCPSGSTAIYTPWRYRGMTGAQICAADSRGLTTCAAVIGIYCTENNGCNHYAPYDGACSDGVDSPWPWGDDGGAAPDTLDGEWGHPDLSVVCCK